MIEIGKQTIQLAANHYDKGPILETITEKFIKLTMPWKREIYSIADGDQMVKRNPRFVVYWHKYPPENPQCTKARWGWQ